MMAILLAFWALSTVLAQPTDGEPPPRIGKPDLTIYSADVDPLNIGPGVMEYPTYYDPIEYRDQATTMDFSEDIPNEGDAVQVNLTVFNIGLESGSGIVSFYDGPKGEGAFIGSDRVTVNAFNYDTATTVWYTQGVLEEEHEIFAYLDPDDPDNETNDQNNAGSESILVNFYPEAEITSFHGTGEVIREGDEVTFDASGSTDTQRDLEAGLVFTWSFDDPNSDASPVEVLDDPFAFHIFQDAGEYIVVLTVSDQHWANRTDTVTVVVENLPPEPVISIQGRSFLEDETVRFGSEGTIDTDYDLMSMEYRWDFGDGTTADWTHQTWVEHAYQDKGRYDVNLIARDDEGVSSSAGIDVTVENVIPAVRTVRISVNGNDLPPTQDSYPVLEDDRIAIEVEAADSPSDSAKLEIAWFDGPVRIGSGAELSISFDERGTYRLRADAIDDDGDFGRSEVAFVVENLAPVADAGPDVVLDTSHVVLDGGGSQDTPSDLQDLVYIWELGDGSYEAGVHIEHDYPEKGTYEAILTVMDDDDAVSTDTVVVEIRNVAPKVIIVAPEVVQEDQVFILDASGTIDPDGEIVDLLWSTDDGRAMEGDVVSVSFSRSGTRRVSLSARDDVGATTNVNVFVEVLNIAPTADAGGDNETLVGWPIVLDGVRSNDTPSDRRNMSFQWEILGVGMFAGEVVEFVSDVPGVFEVVLTVTDDDLATAVDRIILRIRNATLGSIRIELRSDKEEYRKGENVVIQGLVMYSFMDAGGFLDPSLFPVSVIVPGRTYRVLPDEDGAFSLMFPAPAGAGEYEVHARLDRFGVAGEASVTFVVVESDAVLPVWSSPVAIGVGGSLLVLALGGGAVMSTDVGKWRFFLLLVPLFSRLSRDRVLENFERGRIYQYIVMNPGDHFSHIREMLEMNIGTLTYHLSVLQKEEYVKSRTDGRFRRFYPYGMKLDGHPHADIQEMILMQIVSNPGISQKEIASELGVHVSTVNYHVNMMVGAGILRPFRRGQVQRYEVQYHAFDLAIEGA